MGLVRTYLNEEQNFLESGTYGRLKVSDLLGAELPPFHRDMYKRWLEYYDYLIPHLQALQRLPSGQDFLLALQGDADSGEIGENQVLVQLVDDLNGEIDKAKGDPDLQKHLKVLKELLEVELDTNKEICKVLPDSW